MCSQHFPYSNGGPSAQEPPAVEPDAPRTPQTPQEETPEVKARTDNFGSCGGNYDSTTERQGWNQ